MRKKFNPDAMYQPPSGAARICGLSRAYIYRGLHDGTIPHIRVGTDYRVNMPLFLALLDERSKEEQL